MILADLYEKSIRIETYVSQDDITACDCHSREVFIDALREGNLKPSKCRMSSARFLRLLWAAKPDQLLPRTEVLQMPSPGPTGLFPINSPDSQSPILVSGNAEPTAGILSSVLSTTLSPFWFLVVDTHGHTVDMALVYKVLTAERVAEALEAEDADRIAPDSPVVLPGLAAGIGDALAAACRRTVTAGPVCAAELPLFFGEKQWSVALS